MVIELRLRLLEGALVLLRRRRQVAVLKHRQQLPVAHMAPAIDQEFLHRRADLRRNRRLLDRKQHRIGRDFLLHRRLRYRNNLHRHHRLGFSACRRNRRSWPPVRP